MPPRIAFAIVCVGLIASSAASQSPDLAPRATLPEYSAPSTPRDWPASPLSTKNLIPPVPLPPAEMSKTPLVLPGEKLTKWPAWPARDVPPLGSAVIPERPTILAQVVGPKAFVVGPWAEQVPELPPFARAAEKPPTISLDPTAAIDRQLLLTPQFGAGTYPPALVLASIPSSDAHLRGQPAIAPADLDPPAVSFARPERPLMPVPPTLAK